MLSSILEKEPTKDLNFSHGAFSETTTRMQMPKFKKGSKYNNPYLTKLKNACPSSLKCFTQAFCKNLKFIEN